MQEPKIDREKLEIWASFLIDHSLGGIAPGDRVMIKGERIGWPLMEMLERKVLEGGGIPDVFLVAPNNDRGRVWSAAVARYGSQAQIDAVPAWIKARYEAMDKYVEVLGAEDPAAFTGLDPAKGGAIVKADAPMSTTRLSKNWVITLYPTPAMAQMEGMTLDAYADFIVGASTVDPAPLLVAEKKITPLIDAGKTVEITTAHPDGRELTLKMSIAPCFATMSYGTRNFPDGEVFTSPDANSVNGEIFVDLPIRNGGVDVSGIYLNFEGGNIVAYSAKEGGEQLGSIIETDEGSHRLGEVAWGMNPGLDKVLKHPLFVEKVGGTMHIAIGASYPNCYVKDTEEEGWKANRETLVSQGVINESAQHVDIVIDFRPGGAGRKVIIDDTELVVQDGVWVPR